MGGHSSKESESDTMAHVIINPRLKHTGTLIFLHGLGDTGHGWAAGFEQLALANIRCVCPNAPIQRVTLNQGMSMPSWYDIYQLASNSKEDEDGIRKGAQSVTEIIKSEEASGIASNRIILGGFSQGGALALYTALTYDKPLAGIIGLSTYLPLREKFPQLLNDANKDTPFFQCHGKADMVIPYSWGTTTHDILKTFKPSDSVTFKMFADLGHSSCEEEMTDVKGFIEKYLPD